MKAQKQRTQIRPGVTARRRPTASASTTINRSRNAPRASRRKSERRGQGARVIWLLMIIGGLIASGFLLAQHSQINAHQLKQAEEKFKTQLDELSNQHRYLALTKERATNPQESERIARQSGLAQLQFNKSQQIPVAAVTTKAVTAPSAKPTATVKQAIKPAAAPASKPMAKSTAKPTAPQAKPAAKQMASKVAAQSSKDKVTTSGKASKDGKNQRQLAQNQDVKKEKRR